VLNRSIVDIAKQRGLHFTTADGSDVLAAAKQAKSADVAILFLGLSESVEGEGHDRKSLELPADQLALAAAVVAAQPYTVVVLVNGGALAIEALVSGPSAVPAIIESFYPGQSGAEATMMSLLGESNRFGKLPYTMYPATFIQRNPFNFDLRADGGLTYMHYDGKYGKPLFDFGHGLSYTTFSYAWGAAPTRSVAISDLLDTTDFNRNTNSGDGRGGGDSDGGGRGDGDGGDGACYDCSKIMFSVTVTNTGYIAGDAVVLGYVSPTTTGQASTMLFDFARVTLGAGASSTIQMRMDRGCKQSVAQVDAAGTVLFSP
jgi:hypothetical protein